MSSAADLHEALTSAVEQIRSSTPQNRSHGILITRLRPDTFNIEFSEDVPHGITYARYAK